MRVPELSLEPGPFENRWAWDDEAPEDEGRIHELVKIANRKTKPRSWDGRRS